MFICILTPWTKTMPDATFSVRLPDTLKERLDAYASLTQRSRSFIVKEAIASYIKDRAAYLAELNEAVESIDSSPSYDFENVSAWMKTWGAKDEKSLSKIDLSQFPVVGQFEIHP